MTKKAILASVAVGLLVAMASVAAYAYGKHRMAKAAQAHIVSRGKAIISHSLQRPSDVVVFGDSIVELAELSDLCPGMRTLNAGISGARTQDIAAIADRVISIAKPKVVFIGVGTNDAWAHKPTASADFLRSYRGLIASAEKSGARVLLLNLPPLGDENFSLSAIFSREELAKRRAEIATLGPPVIDTMTLLAGSAGFDPAFTDDGVHPNARGYARWTSALSERCPV